MLLCLRLPHLSSSISVVLDMDEAWEGQPVPPECELAFQGALRHSFSGPDLVPHGSRPCVVQVTEAQYAEFFKQTFQEFMDPAAKMHFSAEGTIEFTALLFIPGMAPFQPEVGIPWEGLLSA